MINTKERISAFIAISLLSLSVATANAGTIPYKGGEGAPGTGDEGFELIYTSPEMQALMAMQEEVGDSTCLLAEDEEVVKLREIIKKNKEIVRRNDMYIRGQQQIIDDPDATDEEKAKAKANKENAEKANKRNKQILKRQEALLQACLDNPLPDDK